MGIRRQTGKLVLAAGLFWGLSLGDGGTSIKVFLLGCVLVAGLYGAATASREFCSCGRSPSAWRYLH